MADPTLTHLALGILKAPSATDKSRLSGLAAAEWFAGRLRAGEAQPMDRPARPRTPELLPPRQMPRRRLNTAAGRIAMVHAFAHIELNAIDLAWDIIARFADAELPNEFYDDWVRVGADEARHFTLLNDLLLSRGSFYGALPAHDGLWEAAENTADDLLARLAIVPLVLEARGLDIVPGVIEKFAAVGEAEIVQILKVIEADEVTHVETGVRWFNRICETRNIPPVGTFHNLVRNRFKGQLKEPFSTARRAEAGLTTDYYLPLSRA